MKGFTGGQYMEMEGTDAELIISIVTLTPRCVVAYP